MRGCGDSELESVEGEEAVVGPGRPPEPRAPEPRAPLPEPGLDLSLSPRPEDLEPRQGSPRRRRQGGSRRGRQVRFRLAPASPARSESLPTASASSDRPEPPQELEYPAPHSSLALSLELQAARAAAGGQFDAAKAVEEQLRKSFQVRCGLEDNVTEGLNVPRSKRLFRDLVSLQVPEEQVLNAALREKLALLPPQARAPAAKVKGQILEVSPTVSASQPRGRFLIPSRAVILSRDPDFQQEPPGPGPDMTILCDPETLVYESPHLTLDGLPPLRLQPRPRPSEDTFLMHRTLRRWEA